MQALLSTHPGGPDALTLSTIATPVPGPGELCVRVLACAINYPDVLLLEDRYQVKPQRPFAPGTEIAAVVETIGPEVTGWEPGQRLIAMIGYGGLAEKAVLRADQAFHLPAALDPAEGSALLMTYATALHGLDDRGALQAGERLLVLGGAGGVGLAATEVGKALGATVISAVSGAAKAEAARRAGADEVLIYPADPADSGALMTAFKAAGGERGFDVVLDPVGGAYSEPALRALAWGGRFLTVGFPAGIPCIPLNYILFKGCDVRGVFWGEFAKREPERNRAHVERLLGWWVEGKIRPHVARKWPLSEGADAIRWLASRQAIGKAVVEISSA